MSRRSLVMLALLAASSSLAGCADVVTAPARPMLTARTSVAPGGIALGTCRGGWVSSVGRCQ